MATDSDWGRAAETLGMTVRKRKLFSRDAKKTGRADRALRHFCCVERVERTCQ
jgi:hypothetical protein